MSARAVSTHNNFTLLRLLLATLVVLGHFKTLPDHQASGLFAYADMAVQAFFIVSGYLVFASFDRQPELRPFYLHRLFRIYPLYLVTVLVQGIAMAIASGGVAEHGMELMHYLALNLAMANFMAYDVGGILSGLPNPGINPSLWTLKIEVAFYLILPLLWYGMRRWGAGFLLSLYVLSTLYAAVTLDYGMPALARQLPGQIRYFVAGMALYRYRDRITPSVPQAAVMVVLLIILCSFRHTLPLLAVYPLCLGLLVTLCALRLPALPLPFDMSYGVYLFHGPLIQFALLFGLFEDSAHFLAVLLVVVYVLAFIAEHIIERPGITLGRKLASVKRVGAA